MVSRIPFLQCGQSGVFTFFIRWRTMPRGMWPVLSWMRRLAWLRRSWSIMWRKLLEGSKESILFESVCRFEVFHSVCHWVFIFFFRTCLVAETLTGRGFRRRNAGRSFGSLEIPDAADFAASSARSFPSMSSWPGVHISVTSHFTLSLHSFHPMFPSVSRVLPVPFL